MRETAPRRPGALRSLLPDVRLPGAVRGEAAIAAPVLVGGFQGGIRLVVPLAGERDRAGVLSLLYIVSYLGLGVPAVIAGVLVTEVNGLLDTAREYGSAVIVLAALALGGLLLHRPGKAPAGAPVPAGRESSR